MMKKKVFVISIVIVFITVSGAMLYNYYSPANITINYTDHEVYNNVERLEKEAELIVVVSPEKSSSEYESKLFYNPMDGSLDDYQTNVEVKVKKVIKGEWDKSKTILVANRVAYFPVSFKKKKDIMMTEDTITFEKGKSYLLFLVKTNDGKYYSPLSINQGMFELGDNQTNPYKHENAQYNNLKKDALEKFRY